MLRIWFRSMTESADPHPFGLVQIVLSLRGDGRSMIRWAAKPHARWSDDLIEL
jgi:hypothetical protein